MANLKTVHSREGFGPGAVYYWSLPATAPPPMSASIRASSNTRAHMDAKGAQVKRGSLRFHGKDEQSLHVRPQPSCAPSNCMRKHEGEHGAHVEPSEQVHHVNG